MTGSATGVAVPPGTGRPSTAGLAKRVVRRGSPADPATSRRRATRQSKESPNPMSPSAGWGEGCLDAGRRLPFRLTSVLLRPGRLRELSDDFSPTGRRIGVATMARFRLPRRWSAPAQPQATSGRRGRRTAATSCRRIQLTPTSAGQWIGPGVGCTAGRTPTSACTSGKCGRRPVELRRRRTWIELGSRTTPAGSGRQRRSSGARCRQPDLAAPERRGRGWSRPTPASPARPGSSRLARRADNGGGSPRRPYTVGGSVSGSARSRAAAWW